MPPRATHLVSDSPEATHEIAHRLAKRLGSGDVLLLAGDVGAGKTHFARGVILALLDEAEDVPSPTYTLVQSYVADAGEIWHADLYRLTDTSELEELGLFAAFDSAICLVEWPDRLGNEVPEDALVITFVADGKETQRRMSFSWIAPKWDNRLEGIGHE